MTSLSRPRVEFISTILQTVLNLGLLCRMMCCSRQNNPANMSW